MTRNRKCGFFNSNSEGDRPYDAEDISQMMTGMITGGVFPNVGEKFAISVSGTEINIGTGKAWWHGKWFENTTKYTIDDGASSEYDRIDILVIEINETEEVRDGYFKIVKGIPGNPAVEPILVNEGGIYQLPIAKITRIGGDIEIAKDKVKYLVGTTASPWAETALDPNKAVYAYVDDTEEVDLDTMVLGGTEIMKSTGFRSSSNGRTYYISKIINFKKPFKVIPVIIATIAEPSYIIDNNNMAVYVANVTKNSAVIQINANFNPSSVETDIHVNWIATGLTNE